MSYYSAIERGWRMPSPRVVSTILRMLREHSVQEVESSSWEAADRASHTTNLQLLLQWYERVVTLFTVVYDGGACLISNSAEPLYRRLRRRCQPLAAGLVAAGIIENEPYLPLLLYPTTLPNHWVPEFWENDVRRRLTETYKGLAALVGQSEGEADDKPTAMVSLRGIDALIGRLEQHKSRDVTSLVGL